MTDTSLVVIGASAGGVESLRRLVSHLPIDLPAAVAVVLHLAPTSKSMLAAILTRSGPLPAEQAVDGQPVTAGRIVVAAPDHHLVVEDSVFRVTRGATENSARPAVDPLFRTAARVFGSRAVGVVLSGSLDDGTAGLFEIKRRGGWTLVQDPKEALHPDMPQSALEHVQVDIVDDSAALAGHIAQLVRRGTRSSHLRWATDRQETVSGSLPSGMSCPDCNGQLWEIGAGPLRYRCRVGHEWAPKALVEGQERSLENALWMSLRIVGERLELTRKMLERAAEQGHHHVVHLLETRQEELAADEEMLRAALVRPVRVVPEDAPLALTAEDDRYA